MITVSFGQSVSPDVIATSGDYFQNANVSLSWTMGELITETFSNGNIALTQGFQQPLSITIHGIDLDVLVYLEGPYNETDMNTDLTGLNDFPTTQPYNLSPWNYTGTENASPIPPDVVDWVLVELRDAVSPETATTSVAQQAAFLLKDGSVVGMDGSSVLQFPAASFDYDIYVVVWHRNHLGVMSNSGAIGSGGVYSYNFSTGAGQAYGGADGHKDLGAVYGMFAGDGNANDIVEITDKTVWANLAGQSGYYAGDYNLDAQNNNQDKNDKWYPNINEESQVPE